MTDPAVDAQVDTSPLVKVRRVACSADHAFDTFVDRMDAWWPKRPHSVYAEDAASVVVEPGVGGRIVETSLSGETTVWGVVHTWEPKRRLAFSWHPGRGPDEATDVEVAFEPHGEGCVVTLTHAGWGRAGRDQARAGYDNGWELVLDRYVSGL